MTYDFGTQDNWFNSEPSRIQYSTNNFDLSTEDNWFGGEPSRIQYQKTSSATPSTDPFIGNQFFQILGIGT